MAKCIQVVGQGIPVRMSDDDAYQIVVRDEDGEFCSKAVWREFYKSSYYVERGDKGFCRLVGKQITRVDNLEA